MDFFRAFLSLSSKAVNVFFFPVVYGLSRSLSAAAVNDLSAQLSRMSFPD